MTNRVALIVGHNSSDQGAVNYLGQSEWDFNSGIAQATMQLLVESGVQAEVFFRNPNKSYTGQVNQIIDEVTSFGADFSVELHFNSYNSSARGSEVLIPESGTGLDNKFADILTDKLEEEFGIIQRRDDGVYEIDESAAGGMMVYGLYEAGVINGLVEPCFGERSPESEAFFPCPNTYSRILTNSIIEGFELEVDLIEPEMPEAPTCPDNDLLLEMKGDALASMNAIRDISDNFINKWSQE